MHFCRFIIDDSNLLGALNNVTIALRKVVITCLCAPRGKWSLHAHIHVKTTFRMGQRLK